MSASPSSLVELLDTLGQHFTAIRSSVMSSEEYAFVRKTLIRLCVFVAIVIFALAGSLVIKRAGDALPDPASGVLSFVDFLILLTDALWFTVSLTKEIAEWLERSGITKPKKGVMPAMIIMVLLSLVAVGVAFKSKTGTVYQSVGVRIETKR